MKIQIIIKKGEIGLQLLNDREIIDSSTWTDEHNLSQTLLVEIENLIKRNQLSKLDREKIEVKAEIKESFTSVRIAEAVARTWNIA